MFDLAHFRVGALSHGEEGAWQIDVAKFDGTDPHRSIKGRLRPATLPTTLVFWTARVHPRSHIGHGRTPHRCTVAPASAHVAGENGENRGQADQLHQGAEDQRRRRGAADGESLDSRVYLRREHCYEQRCKPAGDPAVQASRERASAALPSGIGSLPDTPAGPNARLAGAAAWSLVHGFAIPLAQPGPATRTRQRPRDRCSRRHNPIPRAVTDFAACGQTSATADEDSHRKCRRGTCDSRYCYGAAITFSTVLRPIQRIRVGVAGAMRRASLICTPSFDADRSRSWPMSALWAHGSVVGLVTG